MAAPAHTVVDLPETVSGGGAHQPLGPRQFSGRDQRAGRRGRGQTLLTSDSEDSGSSDAAGGTRGDPKRQVRKGACAAEKWAARDGHTTGVTIRKFFTSANTQSGQQTGQKSGGRAQASSRRRRTAKGDRRRSAGREGSGWSGDASGKASGEEGTGSGSRAPTTDDTDRGQAGTPRLRRGEHKARSRTGEGHTGPGTTSHGAPRHAPNSATGGPPLF